MPEGPEIKRAAQRIAKVLVGQVAEKVEFGLPRLQRFSELLSGDTIVDVRPRGKALLTRFEQGLTIYSHNQLYGCWYINKRGVLPNTQRTLRVAVHTHERSALLYSASDIEVLDDDALAQHPFLRRLGPDVLDEQLAWREIAQRLASTEFSRRAVGGLYLNQQFLAGIGNYMRSEILFAAKLWPWTQPQHLSRKQLGQLARLTLKISQQAYATSGVTNTAARVRRLQKAGVRREDYRFMVFGRDGLPCYLCATPISRDAISSRRLYYCPTCQPNLTR